MSESEQKCRECKVKKPLDEFPKSKKNKNGYMKTCLECKPEKRRNLLQWKRPDPEFPPDKRLKFLIRETHTPRRNLFMRHEEEDQDASEWMDVAPDDSETTETWYDTFEDGYKVYKELEKSPYRKFENGQRNIDMIFIEADDFVNTLFCCWAR